MDRNNTNSFSPARTQNKINVNQTNIARPAARSPTRLSPNTSSFAMQQKLVMKSKLQSEALAETKNMTPFQGVQQRGGPTTIHGSGGSVGSYVGSNRTIVNVNVNEARIFKANGGVFLRTAFLTIVCGNQVKTIKSTRFLIDAKGTATYIFEQKCMFIHVDEKDIVGGVEILLSSSDRRENQIGTASVAVAGQTLSNFNIGTWVSIFPSGSRTAALQQAIGEVKLTANSKVEDYLSDSESDNSGATTPCSVISTAEGLMRLTSTGAKENDTPMPTPLANIESLLINSDELGKDSSSPACFLSGQCRQNTPYLASTLKPTIVRGLSLQQDLAAEDKKKEEVVEVSRVESTVTIGGVVVVDKTLDTVQHPAVASTENIITSTIQGQSTSAIDYLLIPFNRLLLAFLVSFGALLIALAGGRFEMPFSIREPQNAAVRVMTKNATSSSASFYDHNVIHAREPVSIVTPVSMSISTPVRPTALMISAPHGKQVQIVDGRDSSCLHWKNGLFGGHARFQSCDDQSWWTMQAGEHGLRVEHSNGKCLCPRNCASANTGLTLKSCDRCACAEGWSLSEQTGQLSKPIWGKARRGEPATETLSCLSRKAERGPKTHPFPFRFPDLTKAKASLKLCYMNEALTNTHAVSPTATTSAKGHVEIALSKYYKWQMAIAAPE